MSLYLPVKARGTAAIAICARCQQKVYHDDLSEDPNTKLMVCDGCRDQLDPWRLPPRGEDKIALAHPRPDVELE